MFIDYIKAYDNVCRQDIINMLTNKGCGTQFVGALANSMSNTSAMIGSTRINTTKGVRQGTPSSCLIFTFLLDHVSQKLNS